MNAIKRKSFFLLPKHEQEALRKAMSDSVYEIVDKEEKEMQVVWIKLACIILHDVFGLGEIRLLRFIAAWKRMYRRQARYKNSKDRDAWLDAEMKKLFPKNGFPDVRIEEMKEM